MKCLSVRLLFCLLFNSRTTILSTDPVQLYIMQRWCREGVAIAILYHPYQPLGCGFGGKEWGHSPERWCFVEFLAQEAVGAAVWVSSHQCSAGPSRGRDQHGARAEQQGESSSWCLCPNITAFAVSGTQNVAVAAPPPCLCPGNTPVSQLSHEQVLFWPQPHNWDNGLVLQLTAGKVTGSAQHF